MSSAGVPFANILHQEVIAELAGSSSFERGKRYFRERRVVSLARRDGSLTATVNGTGAYAVKIWAHLDTLAYTCSCPQGQEKTFCKHAVATALAWLDGGPKDGAPASFEADTTAPPPSSPAPSTLPSDGDSADARQAQLILSLEARTKEELIALLLGAARTDQLLRARILRG